MAKWVTHTNTVNLLLVFEATPVFLRVLFAPCTDWHKTNAEEIRPRNAKMFQRLKAQTMFPRNYCKNALGHAIFAGFYAIDFDASFL